MLVQLDGLAPSRASIGMNRNWSEHGTKCPLCLCLSPFPPWVKHQNIKIPTYFETPEGLVDMFEGNFADMCADNFRPVDGAQSRGSSIH